MARFWYNYVVGNKSIFVIFACGMLSALAIAQTPALTGSPKGSQIPDGRVARRAIKGPKISAESATIIDGSSGKVLWSKNQFEPMFPASTTKVMTALLLIENFPADYVLTAPSGIEKVGGSSLHLKSGEKITAENMLYALMLRSANDGCVTIAYNLAGSVPNFVKLMNNRAHQLGCTHIHFNNPNGLPDADHWVTAHDMAFIAREAMKYPIFRQVVKTTRYRVERSIDEKDVNLTNTDKELRKDPTADGIKTGWTVAAGHCFIGSATRSGFRVIDDEYHSKNWQKDDRIMLDWAYANFRHIEVSTPATFNLPLQQTNGSKTISASLESPLSIVTSSDGVVPAYTLAEDLTINDPNSIASGSKIGEIRAIDASGTEIGQAPLFANGKDAATSAAVQNESSKFSYPFLLIGGVMIGGAVVVRQKNRRRMMGGNYPPNLRF